MVYVPSSQSISINKCPHGGDITTVFVMLDYLTLGQLSATVQLHGLHSLLAILCHLQWTLTCWQADIRRVIIRLALQTWYHYQFDSSVEGYVPQVHPWWLWTQWRSSSLNRTSYLSWWFVRFVLIKTKNKYTWNDRSDAVFEADGLPLWSSFTSL